LLACGSLALIGLAVVIKGAMAGKPKKKSTSKRKPRDQKPSGRGGAHSKTPPPVRQRKPKALPKKKGQFTENSGGEITGTDLFFCDIGWDQFVHAATSQLSSGEYTVWRETYMHIAIVPCSMRVQAGDDLRKNPGVIGLFDAGDDLDHWRKGVELKQREYAESESDWIHEFDDAEWSVKYDADARTAQFTYFDMPCGPKMTNLPAAVKIVVSLPGCDDTSQAGFS
jgi:hypothetical protein